MIRVSGDQTTLSPKGVDMTNHDIFISHASEDKDDLVRPLANELTDLGMRVWYDEYTLSIGDSLSGSIDRGLADSRHGVVILSPSFLDKSWPEYEFRSLVALESIRQRRIIPVWYNVTRDDILEYSPNLADKIALSATGRASLHVALEIIQTTNPGKYSELARRAAAREAAQDSTPKEYFKTKDIAKWPALREPLTQPQLRRLKLVREALFEVFPQTWDDMVSDFQRDRPDHRESEIACWEQIAGDYLNVTRRHELSDQEKKTLFSLLLAATWGEQIPNGKGQPDWVNTAARNYYKTLPNARIRR